MKARPEDFARHEFRDYSVYKALAEIETHPHFRSILEQLAAQEWNDYQGWLALSEEKNFTISAIEIPRAKFLRKILGITFIARYLKRREKKTITAFNDMIAMAPAEHIAHIQNSIDHELANEQVLIEQIKEEKIEFVSSIILGLNDGLIELTGAMVGFSFALQKTQLVALTGSITGIAAALSMASSAYMQAKHDESGKDPKKAALYTGISYFIVVVLLISPFVIAKNTYIALLAMAVIIMLIITSISYYTAVLFGRSFRSQLSQMFIFSIGVAALSFVIGSALREMTGITI